MFGSAGGIVEFRAAMMANRGILSYALPYVFLDESVQFEISYFKVCRLERLINIINIT